MTPHALHTNLQNILRLRTLFLQENNFQIRYNACHERGWTDSYIITCNEIEIGYGSIKGNEDHNDRDTVFEFYIIPSFRNLASAAFAALLHASQASYIECQSNDLLLTTMLYHHAQNINAPVILFEEGTPSQLHVNNIIFRKKSDDDIVYEHTSEPVGEYVLEHNKKIVATGGFLLHYNKPFADLYMEVKETHRRKGYGSFLIQEIKKASYLAGRVPAARCSIDNTASKKTLLKAGFKIAGFMLLGNVRK
jgi:GNAT superfamily N-acetyltransferase